MTCLAEKNGRCSFENGGKKLHGCCWGLPGDTSFSQ